MGVKNQQITIIGAGNLAWHLAPALDNVGYIVGELYSKSIKNANRLINRLYQANLKTDLDFSESDSKIFIIAASDDAIVPICEKIVVPSEAILVHTSGSQPLESLHQYSTANIGVFYPLQTFSQAINVDFSDIPICIEAYNKETWRVLKTMGSQLTKKIYTIDSASREALHIAAVFACNFTNHLFTITDEILNKNNLEFEMMKPLIVETINKSLEIGPKNAQTGPARRGDMAVLDRHMSLLKQNKAYANVYKAMTQHILDTYHG